MFLSILSMELKREKVLFIISNWQTSFSFSYRDLFYKEFDVDFLQVITLEDKNIYPREVTTLRYIKPWHGIINKFLNHIYFYIKVIIYIKKNKYDLVCQNVIPSPADSFLFLYKLFLGKKYKFYLGLCTPLGESQILKRILSYNLKLFRYIGGDTPLLRKELHLEKRKLYRGNMGYSERYGYKERNFNSINLVYIGVQGIRRIDKTVDGLSIFIKNNPNIRCTYDIIGGDQKSIDIINDRILKHGLEEVVKCHGFLSLNDVQTVFDRVNIGVSFVPKIKMYDGVSVTKTVEYLLCGMPVIGTSVTFNTDLIDGTSGVLCEDTPEDFASALEELHQKMHKFSSSAIRSKYEYLSSDKVIVNTYLPNLKEIIRNENIS